MDRGSLLDISQLSNEMETNEAIIKFLVKKFKKWVPGINHKGAQLYTARDLITLIFLQNRISNGILPVQIEKEFSNSSFSSTNFPKQSLQTEDSEIAAKTLKVLEKRNEIETLKLQALNRIAQAMENSDVPIFQQGLHQDNVEIIDELSKPVEAEPGTDTPTQGEPEVDTIVIDDLSKLIENISETDNQSQEPQKVKVDDLSSLINAKPDTIDEIDNLSRLIEGTYEKKTNNTVIDDLSVLIDNNAENDLKIDDLSQLLEENRKESDNIDDLSILTNDETFQNGTIDNLSSLIEPVIDPEPEAEIDIPKPEFSPKKDFENYKSEIINIIIDLKNKGLSKETTCERFNKEGILTFSGKKNWSVKTISQVYQLIDNAA